MERTVKNSLKLFLKACPRQYYEFSRYATVIKFLLFDYRLHVASVNFSTLFLKNVKEKRGGFHYKEILTKVIHWTSLFSG